MEGGKGGRDGGGTLVSMYNEKKLLNRKLKKTKTNKQQKTSLDERVRKRKIIPSDLRKIILKDF